MWGSVLTDLAPLHRASACREYLAALPALGFTAATIPQLADVGRVLAGAGSGWSLRPVAGLMHPRDFLAGLAFRTFHATQYVRHHAQPAYTPEPDALHELVGHVPLLLDADYAAMVHALGVASLGAPDPAVWALTRVYWHTVEFGVVMEEAGAGAEEEEGAGEALHSFSSSSPSPQSAPPRRRTRSVPKAFGAGILSSPGELAHFGAGQATLAPLDLTVPLPRMAYKEGYQAHYFTLPSFAAGAEMLAAHAAATTPQAVRARFGLVGLGAGRLVPAGVPVAGPAAAGGGGGGAPTPDLPALASSVVPLPPGVGAGGRSGAAAGGERPRPASPQPSAPAGKP